MNDVEHIEQRAAEVEAHAKRVTAPAKIRPTMLMVLGAALLMSVTGLGFAIAAFFGTTPEPLADPLGDYPVQRVDSRTEEMPDQPSVLLSDGIIVITGTKCAKTATPVKGELSWLAIEPPGATFPLGGGNVVRTAGCTTRTYRNQIPDLVRERCLTLAAKGVRTTTWQIVGSDTPYGANGDGVVHHWETQNFTILVP